jgi:hypothetical protein
LRGLSGKLAAADITLIPKRLVHKSLRTDMAFSRLIVQIIRNRNLNSVWLRALRIIASRARIDPDYADRIGCVLTGLTQPSAR